MKMSSFEHIWTCLCQVPLGINTLRLPKPISWLEVPRIKEAVYTCAADMCKGRPCRHKFSTMGLFLLCFYISYFIQCQGSLPYRFLGKGEGIERLLLVLVYPEGLGFQDLSSMWGGGLSIDFHIVQALDFDSFLFVL